MLVFYQYSIFDGTLDPNETVEFDFDFDFDFYVFAFRFLSAQRKAIFGTEKVDNNERQAIVAN